MSQAATHHSILSLWAVPTPHIKYEHAEGEPLETGGVELKTQVSTQTRHSATVTSKSGIDANKTIDTLELLRTILRVNIVGHWVTGSHSIKTVILMGVRQPDDICSPIKDESFCLLTIVSSIFQVRAGQLA